MIWENWKGEIAKGMEQRAAGTLFLSTISTNTSFIKTTLAKCV